MLQTQAEYRQRTLAAWENHARDALVHGLEPASWSDFYGAVFRATKNAARRWRILDSAWKGRRAELEGALLAILARAAALKQCPDGRGCAARPNCRGLGADVSGVP